MKKFLKISLAVFAVLFVCGFLFHAKIQVAAESLLPNPSETSPSIPMSVSFLEEENTLLFSFFEADIESVTIAPPFFSVSEPGAFSFKISADPSVFSEKTFSISYREDWEAVPQEYTLKTAVPNDDGLVFFRDGEIKEGELWIAFANETKSETAFVDEEKDMPGIYLNQSFRIKKGGMLAVFGKGACAVGSSYPSSSTGVKNELFVEEGGVFIAEVSSFYNGVSFNPLASSSGTLQIAGHMKVSVSDSFYNGESDIVSGNGAVYVHSKGLFSLQSEDTVLDFYSYEQLPPLSEYPFFINGEGAIYLNWDGTSSSVRTPFQKEMVFHDDIGAVLPDGVFIAGMDCEIKWEVLPEISVPGEYIVKGYFSALHAEQIEVSTVLNAGKIVPEVPSLPELLMVSTDRFALMDVNGCEYSLDNGTTWVENPLFLNLKPASKYAVIARYQETEFSLASANSVPLLLTTQRLSYAASADACLVEFSDFNKESSSFEIYAYGDFPDDLNPIKGDYAYFPQSWKMSGQSGAWSNPPYKTSVQPAKAGALPIFVTFSLYYYDGEAWVEMNETFTRMKPVYIPFVFTR